MVKRRSFLFKANALCVCRFIPLFVRQLALLTSVVTIRYNLSKRSFFFGRHCLDFKWTRSQYFFLESLIVWISNKQHVEKRLSKHILVSLWKSRRFNFSFYMRSAFVVLATVTHHCIYIVVSGLCKNRWETN